MLIVVTGGSACGKSSITEYLSTKFGKNLGYIATMVVAKGDLDAEKRVAKHVKMREGKGFTTLEIPYNIGEHIDEIKQHDLVVLECISNLFANEMFLNNKSHIEAKDDILRDMKELLKTDTNFIVVTNEVFSDSNIYDEFSANYLEGMGKVNQGLANLCDVYIKSVVGIPLCYKGADLIKDYLPNLVVLGEDKAKNE